MFSKSNYDNYKVAFEGVNFKTTVWGKNTSLGEFKLKKDSIIPSHKHPHEQTGYLISGSMKFFIDKQEFIAEPGDSWNILGNVEHGVEVLEDTVVIEVFSPVRQEYL